jgi:hypothetical protein
VAGAAQPRQTEGRQALGSVAIVKCRDVDVSAQSPRVDSRPRSQLIGSRSSDDADERWRRRQDGRCRPSSRRDASDGARLRVEPNGDQSASENGRSVGSGQCRCCARPSTPRSPQPSMTAARPARRADDRLGVALSVTVSAGFWVMRQADAGPNYCAPAGVGDAMRIICPRYCVFRRRGEQRRAIV